MNPLQKAIEKVKQSELITKEGTKPTGLVELETVIKIMEEMEVDMLNTKNEKTRY